VQGVNEDPGHLTGRKAHQITTANPEADSADAMNKPTSTAILNCNDVGTREAARCARLKPDLNAFNRD
jgi:hypothetical protein